MIVTKPSVILNSSGGDIATTLDSYYFLGQGARGGKEREFVVIIKNELSENNRSADGELPSGKLLRSGCV